MELSSSGAIRSGRNMCPVHYLTDSRQVLHVLQLKSELEPSECTPVVRRGAEFVDSCAVLCRSVTGIAFPPVAGIPDRETAHESVPYDLGDNRGTTDRVDQGIPPHHRLVLSPQLFHRESVHYDVVGLRFEVIQCPLHCRSRRAKNVEILDFANRSCADADAKSRRHYPTEEFLSDLGGQPFRIICPIYEDTVG